MKTLTILLTFLFATSAFSIEHFAFFGDAMNGVGNGNYIQKTQNISTMHFITAPAGSTASEMWKEKVLEAKVAGNKSVLMLENVLFDWATVRPRADRKVILEQLKQNLAGLEDSIVAIYLIDEPYFKNSLSPKPLTLDQTLASLQESALLVKSFFPNAKLAMTEAYPSFKLNFKIPASIDWAGVNCYLAFGNECSLEKVKQFNQALFIKMLPHQRFIFTLDAYWGNPEASKSTVQASIIARNTELLKLAQKYNAVALVPFLYQTQIGNGEHLRGANEMPLVMNYLSVIGKNVKNKTFNYSNVCEAIEPRCEGRDFVRRNSCGTLLERWKNAPSPYCPAAGEVIPAKAGCFVQEPVCEDGDYVRRDSCGNMMERWEKAPAPYCNKK